MFLGFVSIGLLALVHVESDAGAAAAPEVDAGASLYKTTVVGRRPVTAASATVLRDRDLELRPRARAADILQATPGLFVAQHAGGGKANQYFLRGFDADHGTDVALFVDGVPVNLVSHGHGQGYADLHWLIPEVVERVEVSKGPCLASLGDFATAGAINIVTRDAHDEHRASVSGGSFRTFRTLLTASPKENGWRALVAAEVYTSDGPFKSPEGLQRTNVFTKWTRDLSARTRLSLALTSYAGGWNSSGQIPASEVVAGRLDRFGSIDPTEGGASQRHSFVLRLNARPKPASEFQLMAYAAIYRLALYSNFTFFSRDATNGDMIEQADARTQAGLNASYRFSKRAGDLHFQTTLGAQMRHDAIENGLFNSVRRERLAGVVEAEIRETSLAAFVQEEIAWTAWLRTVVGLRSDLFVFDVSDKLEDRATTGTRTSGVRHAGFASPKVSVIVSPLGSANQTLNALDLFLNFGMGFHSNDARGVVRGEARSTPLARATGYEVGARARLFDRLDLAGAFFGLDLDSETVWVGDEGTTEARGATRRLGAELELRFQILSWLHVDADATLTDATYISNAGNGSAVALAPRFIFFWRRFRAASDRILWPPRRRPHRRPSRDRGPFPHGPRFHPRRLDARFSPQKVRREPLRPKPLQHVLARGPIRQRLAPRFRNLGRELSRGNARRRVKRHVRWMRRSSLHARLALCHSSVGVTLFLSASSSARHGRRTADLRI